MVGHILVLPLKWTKKQHQHTRKFHHVTLNTATVRNKSFKILDRHSFDGTSVMTCLRLFNLSSCLTHLLRSCLSAPALTSLLILSFSFLREMIWAWQVEGRTWGTATCSCFLIILPLTYGIREYRKNKNDAIENARKVIGVRQIK